MIDRKTKVFLVVIGVAFVLLAGMALGRAGRTPQVSTQTIDKTTEFTHLSLLSISNANYHPGYTRDLFPTWLDLDGNGCDARQDSLLAESLTPPVVSSDCVVVSGQWRSIYDDVSTTNPADLDVDHLVPLGEAWRSGAYAWAGSQRTDFANDTVDPDHLIAVTSSSNRSKSDSPPNEWRPPDEQSWCRYATAWIEVKLKWSLTATTAERDALGQMLDQC